MLILDANGTIFDDWHVAHTATRTIFENFGKECPPIEECIRRVVGGNFHRMYTAYGIDAEAHELRELFVPAYHRARKECAPLLRPHVLSTITWCKAQGIPVHLVTAAHESLILPLLQDEGMDKLWTSVHHSTHDKADCFIELLREHGATSPIPAIAIGDLPYDLESAKKATTHCILLTNNCVPRDLFRDANFHFATNCFLGVRTYIEGYL